MTGRTTRPIAVLVSFAVSPLLPLLPRLDREDCFHGQDREMVEIAVTATQWSRDLEQTANMASVWKHSPLTGATDYTL